MKRVLVVVLGIPSRIRRLSAGCLGIIYTERVMIVEHLFAGVVGGVGLGQDSVER